MKRIILVLALSLLAAPAWAQCNGVFPNNTICGNISGSNAPPKPVSNSALTGVPGGSNLQIQYNNAGVFGGLTDTQVTARINAFTSVLSGAVPASGGGTTKFLRADGTFVTAVTSVGLTNTYGLTPISGSPVTTSGNISADVALTSATGSLGANVAMSSLGSYTDGPSAANGTTGTWFASGTITINDSSASAANFYCKLYDGGAKIAASANAVHPATANIRTTVALSGIISAPAGNIRIACAPQDTTTGTMEFNRTGNSKDSTVTAIRLQ